ncbi:MAG: hypothetical protein F4W95_10070 [Chloroflexi bacterium]|nr:hypothetical protein [Chloroflexota bacterium]MYD48817.1 hypothetical protein [Chloroflexota bacterium]
MPTKQPEPPAPTEHAAADGPTLNDAIRDHVRTYALWHGRPQAAQHFGVPRHSCGASWNGDTWAGPCPER